MELPEKSKPGGFKDADMQLIIGWILRGGVIASMIVVVIGGIFFVYRHGHSIPDYNTFRKVPAFISSPMGILEGVIHLKGQAIIQLGIVLLIITPVLRVLFSAIGFILERDRLYTFISLLVLLIIIMSAITGHAG